MHSDGGNLYLQVTKGKSGKLRRSWIFRFTPRRPKGGPRQRARDMGIGGLDTLGLAEAREKAKACRALVLENIDPIEHRKAKVAAAVLEASKAKTFDQCRDAYFREHSAKWKNQKHRNEWMATLTSYASPVFGKMPVKDVDLPLVIRALEPIWAAKPETASRTRGRIEAVLDWAAVSGLRTGDNPARWDLLSKRFASRSQLFPIKHHPALPYDEIGAFVSKLRTYPEVSARALEFVILTAARSGEALGATWDEIDLQAKVWTIPGERMKAGKEHRVPLSAPALVVLKRMHEARQGDYVFPGGNRRSTRSSGMSLNMLLRRMGHGDITVHGFRSTFRDWVGERTSFEGDAAEAALAHAVGDKTRAAYERGDKFEKRRHLMDAWAAFCSGRAAAKVTPLRSAV
jgi:integrase